MSKEEALSREEQDFINAQAYHGQLLSEIVTLFKIYCAMCGEHAKEVEPALARAIFFTLFGTMEASCRVLATSALLADSTPKEKDESLENGPFEPLTESEKQFLRQETEEISTGSWIPQQRTRFVAFQDALIGYPTIYARICGIHLSIDKSRAEWQDLMRLKSLRDLGAHGNTNELRSSPASMRVSYDDIRRLLECRRWYCGQLTELPWVAEVEAKQEIDFLDRLLEAGFSEKCRKIRAKRNAQQKDKPDKK